MAIGVKELRTITLGRESTNGTGVSPTSFWRGPGGMPQDTREVVMPEEVIGIYGGSDRSYIPKLTAAISLAETPATFQQLPHLQVMGLGMSPTGSAAGSAYVYSAPIPVSGVPTTRSYTIYGGDNAEVEIMTYCHATEFTLSGNGGEALMMSANLAGRSVARQGTIYPGSPTIPDVNEVLFSMGSLYIDAVSGTMGSTLVSNQLLSFSVTFTCKWVQKFTTSGQLYFSYVVYTGCDISGNFTFEHDSAFAAGASGQKASWRNETTQLMRLDIPGSAISGGSAPYTTELVRIDLPIKYTKFSELSDQDGNDTIQADWTSKYNATYGNRGTIIVASTVAAMP